MARESPSLISAAPTAVAPADVHIGHVQLRDLIVCPRERGRVAYVQHKAIAEHNLNRPNSEPHTLAKLGFSPNTLTSMIIPGTDHMLLAAGGQNDGEIHLSCYSPPLDPDSYSRRIWQHEEFIHGSINNSLLLTSLSMTRSNESSVEPRVAVSNNDETVRFLDVPIRKHSFDTLPESGRVRLGVPINHSSLSPDGRTLLSVGDSSKVFLHRLTGGANINIKHISTLSLPSPDLSLLPYNSSALVASFSSSFSSDGTKFAVASQEGVVAVWDVRSSKPLKVFHTDKTRVSLGSGGATGWLTEDPWEWTQGSYKAPGWSARNVKFSQNANGMGKETMMFTEHTSLLHVIDARTFETEEIIHVPSAPPTTRSHARLDYGARVRRTASPPSRRHNHPTLLRSSDFMAAAEETFRIPLPSPGRHSRLHSPSPSQDDDIVIVPPLGDREVEEDVQTLLGRHGIRAVQASDYVYRSGGDAHHTGYRPSDDMEVDELEFDCVSSHTPSRSTSPSPSVNIGGGASRYSFSPARTVTRSSPPREEEYSLDIAGACFDPTGGFIYAATTESVAEWSVKGADKMWWVDSDWA